MYFRHFNNERLIFVDGPGLCIFTIINSYLAKKKYFYFIIHRELEKLFSIIPSLQKLGLMEK
jgi:hypothetical protein